MTDAQSASAHGTCGARTRSGGDCGRPAGWGTGHPGFGHCKLHGGATPNGQAHGSRLAAEHACLVMGLPIETTPADALRAELHWTAGALAWIRGEIRKLSAEDLHWGDSQRIVRGDQGGGPQSFEVRKAARLHPLVLLEQEYSRRNIAVSEVMVRLSLEASTLRLAEGQALMALRVMRQVIADMNPTPEQIELAKVSVHRRFGELVGASPPRELT